MVSKNKTEHKKAMEERINSENIQEDIKDISLINDDFGASFTEKVFKKISILLTLLFSFCLIGLGSLIINDVPKNFISYKSYEEYKKDLSIDKLMLKKENLEKENEVLYEKIQKIEKLLIVNNDNLKFEQQNLNNIIITNNLENSNNNFLIKNINVFNFDIEYENLEKISQINKNNLLKIKQLEDSFNELDKNKDKSKILTTINKHLNNIEKLQAERVMNNIDLIDAQFKQIVLSKEVKNIEKEIQETEKKIYKEKDYEDFIQDVKMFGIRFIMIFPLLLIAIKLKFPQHFCDLKFSNKRENETFKINQDNSNNNFNNNFNNLNIINDNLKENQKANEMEQNFKKQNNKDLEEKNKFVKPEDLNNFIPPFKTNKFN